MMILAFDDRDPHIHPSVFIATGAVISGEVTIGENSNIWYNTVIRGDVSPTIIGRNVSIQDNCTLHQSPNIPLVIEDDAIIGHNAILHSCTVGKGALIGMGAIILDGAQIGEYAMIGAGALVPPGKVIPPRSVAIGSPAKVIREVNDADLADMKRIVRSYVDKGVLYKEAEQKNIHSI